MARRRARLKPEDILWPVSERTIEAINHNFDILFKDMGLFDDVLPVSLGGTGTSSFSKGDVVVAILDTQLGGVNAVATGNALISQGVNTIPAWGKIGLTTHVSGILPIANGGTNASTATTAFNNLSPLTTKGDLLGFDSGNNIRIPVGADNLFLKANSAATGGMEWATGGGTHEILQESVHTDAETNAVTRGAMIIGAGLPFNGETYWLDGSPMPDLDSGVALGTEKYWFDGSDSAPLGMDDPTLVKWRRLGPAAGTLRNNGIDIYWGDDTPTQPRAKAFRTTNVAIATGAGSYGTGTKVDFQSTSFDSHSFWSAGTPSRLTIPTGQAGIYLVIGQASWDTSATGRKAAWIFKNGTRFAIAEVNGDDGGLGLSFTVAAFVSLSVGDYVELVVRQDRGSDLYLLGDSTGQYAQLQLVRIAL